MRCQCTPTRSSGSTAFSQGRHDNMGFAVAGDHGKVQDSTLQRTRCQHARIMVYVVLLEPPGIKGVPASRRRTPMAIFMVPSTLSTWKPCADRRLSYNADFHATADDVLRHGPHRLHGACDQAGSLAVGCRTAKRSSSCACDP